MKRILSPRPDNTLNGLLALLTGLIGGIFIGKQMSDHDRMLERDVLMPDMDEESALPDEEDTPDKTEEEVPEEHPKDEEGQSPENDSQDVSGKQNMD